jgi:hypothetical protein
LLNASTTGWLPRSADQKVISVGPLVGVAVLGEHAPRTGSAKPAASTDRRLGIGASCD